MSQGKQLVADEKTHFHLMFSDTVILPIAKIRFHLG